VALSRDVSIRRRGLETDVPVLGVVDDHLRASRRRVTRSLVKLIRSQGVCMHMEGTSGDSLHTCTRP
jgi:hypothetical protein